MAIVSVVIPAYNAAKYLPDAIDSIRNQTFQDLEIIAIDDCSTDDTWEIIQGYAQNDLRIRAYQNSQNLGIAGNRNRGVSLVTGKYLVWQDADDISMPTRIEKQFQFMQTHQDVAIVGGYIELFRGHSILGIRKYPPDDASLRRCIFRYSPIAQPAAMVRVEALRKVGEYNLKYPPAEDIDMTFRLGEDLKLANLEEVVVRYRESDTSATFTRLRKMELSTQEIRWKYANANNYRMTIGDWIYNIAHYASIWLVPPRLKIRFFNYWRNSVKS